MRLLRFGPLLALGLLISCSGSDDDGDDAPPPARDGGIEDPRDGGEEEPRDGGVTPRDGGETPRDGGSIDPADFPRLRCSDVGEPCVEVPSTAVDLLLDTTNSLEEGLTIILGRGTFVLENAVTLRGANGITFTGQGMDETTLDFSGQMAQSNGVDVVGDQFTITDLTIDGAKKDGLRVEDSTDVVIRRVRATWSNGPSTSNGAYGLYPVKCVNVLIEDSEAFNAADAGIYVGQTIRAVVRRNTAMGNVAGIEIENTQYADVYGNTVEDNTAGLAVFDLPGNPIIGHNVRIHHNTIVRNNRRNFAVGGTTVAQVPAGTGTFAMASRRLEIDNNTFQQNDTVDIAVLSGAIIDPDPSVWEISHADRVGSLASIYVPFSSTGVINQALREVAIHDNTFSGSGTSPDVSDPGARPLGTLLDLLYRPPGGTATPVDNVLYDGIGEMVVPGTAAAGNTNNNHICVYGAGDATYATLDLPRLTAMLDNNMIPTLADLYRPAMGTAPFDCTALSAGPVPPVELPFFEDDDAAFPRRSCADVTGACYEFAAGEENGFLDRINTLSDGDTVILGRGTFMFDNAVTIRSANGVTLAGQGKDVTVLDFGMQTTQSNGVDVVGDDFTIHDLTILDAKKDGLRVEDSSNLVIRRVKATWSGGAMTTNGAYGLYPVKCTGVLMEESEAYFSSDAGLYVGQSINVVVRHNVVAGNVAGLEIENTQFAEVYGNDVQDNSGGLLVFDLPGNPVVGRDVNAYLNYVGENNRENFAQSMTTVSQIPAGTGTFALASRRISFTRNLYYRNDTSDMAFLSGLVFESSTTAWAVSRTELVGDITGVNVPQDMDNVYNFSTNDVYVADNYQVGSGTAPDGADPVGREIGALLSVTYFALGNGPVDSILYDGIGEVVDPMVPGNNTNNNNICIGDNGEATFGVLGIENLANIIGMGGIPSTDDVYQPAPPFAPFDCNGF